MDHLTGMFVIVCDEHTDRLSSNSLYLPHSAFELLHQVIQIGAGENLAKREVQTVRTQPIRVFITDDDKHTGQMVHTAVPIQDEGDESVNRLFLYSEKLV